APLPGRFVRRQRAARQVQPLLPAGKGVRRPFAPRGPAGIPPPGAAYHGGVDRLAAAVVRAAAKSARMKRSELDKAMLNHVIAFALKNRVLVLAASLTLAAYGGYQLTRMPVDVFPDLNRPTVSILTEAPGLAPEEVEVLVTRPIEYLLNGATGVQRVRSASGIGLSVVWVEFEWGSDIYRDRQVVAEKLQLARERLPRDVNPVMAPISSIMGEIMLLGLRWEPEAGKTPTPEELAAKAMELRTLAEFTIRNRLLAVEGVSQVTVMGGTLKQYQVITSPERLAAQNVSLQQLVEAAAKANVIAGGGILERSAQETLIRISGQSLTLKEIEDTPVVWRKPRPVLIKEVADVRF